VKAKHYSDAYVEALHRQISEAEKIIHDLERVLIPYAAIEVPPPADTPDDHKFSAYVVAGQVRKAKALLGVEL
jgi:hypothetical protein